MHTETTILDAIHLQSAHGKRRSPNQDDQPAAFQLLSDLMPELLTKGLEIILDELQRLSLPNWNSMKDCMLGLLLHHFGIDPKQMHLPAQLGTIKAHDREQNSVYSAQCTMRT